MLNFINIRRETEHYLSSDLSSRSVLKKVTLCLFSPYLIDLLQNTVRDYIHSYRVEKRWSRNMKSHVT